jgi:hypothetical protein
LHERVLVLEKEEDESGLAVEESRLQRVIRPDAKDMKK